MTNHFNEVQYDIIKDRIFYYFLGLLSTDGNIQHNSISIELQKKDGENILPYIFNWAKRCKMRPKLDITKFRSSKLVQSGSEYMRLRIYSTMLSRVIQTEYKIPKNKSLILEIFDIPSAFFIDYLRGVFDGDGTIYLKQKRYDIEIYSGSKRYLEQLSNRICAILDNDTEHIRTRERSFANNSLYVLMYYGKQAEKVADIMYSDIKNQPYLARKHSVWSNFIFEPDSRWWTKEHIELLTKKYHSMSPLEIANTIGKTERAVQMKALKIGLRKGNLT